MAQVFAVDIGTLSDTFKSYTSWGSLVSVVLRNAFVLAGIIGFIFLVLGGFSIIMGAGSGESKRIEQGKKTITAAIIGLILIFLSVWIIQIIETITGQSLLNP